MEELTRIRNLRGWSQQRLSEESGVNKATINQIERGKRSPNVETLEKLARAMGVGVADFFPKDQAPLPLEFGAAGEEAVSQLDTKLWRDYCEHMAGVFDMFAEREAPRDQVAGWAETIHWTATYVINLITTLDEMVRDDWFTDEDDEMIPLLRAAYRMAYQGDRVIRRALGGPDEDIEAKFWEIVEGMSLTEEQRKAITA